MQRVFATEHVERKDWADRPELFRSKTGSNFKCPPQQLTTTATTTPPSINTTPPTPHRK